MSEDKQGKPKKNFLQYIKSKMYVIAIVFVALFYIFYGLFDFMPTGKTWVEIVGSIFISLFIGTALMSFLRKDGMKAARDSEIFKASQMVYAESKEKASKYYDKLSAFCAYKTEQEKTETKREIITSANLSYAKYKVGYYNEKDVKDKLEDWQKKALHDANTVKVKAYQIRELLSDLPNEKVGKYQGYRRFGKDENQYDKEKVFGGLFKKLLWATASGLYTLAPLNQDNIPQAIWNAMQIAIWLAFGSVDYMNGKDFMINEYRQTHIVQKASLLDEFVTIMENDPHKLDKYDDELQFQEYLKKQEEKDNDTKLNEKKETEIHTN